MPIQADVPYIIRHFDADTGIMRVDYPGWGSNGTRLNIRLEPDANGNVLTGGLLDQHLRNIQPPPIVIKNAADITALVTPVPDPIIAEEKNLQDNFINIGKFFYDLPDSVRGAIWMAAAKDITVAGVLSRLLITPRASRTDTTFHTDMQVFVTAGLLTQEQVTSLINPPTATATV